MIKKVVINTDYLETFIIPTLDNCIKSVTEAYNNIDLTQIPKEFLYRGNLEKEKENLYIHKNNLTELKSKLLSSIKKTNQINTDIINEINSIRHFEISQKK